MRRSLLVLASCAAGLLATPFLASRAETQGMTEAPAGFDNLSNGFIDQATFDADRAVFEKRFQIADGLGPVYNAQSCAECHQNPVSGSGSQVTNLRSGDSARGTFLEAPGGSLIQDRAIDEQMQERVPAPNDTQTFRMAASALGAGFVESIVNDTLTGIANAQPAAMRGQVILVPVFEMEGTTRVGRFGWKNQHASLLSMTADELLNQIGITNLLKPDENTSLGRTVARFDAVPDPEDTSSVVDAVTEFLRSTKVPPVDVALFRSADGQAGSTLFNQVGCATCHVRTIATAAPGTLINGGAFKVPDALGNKLIHAFSDFLLHNVGTGDGIVQNGGQSTRNRIRTPPLWGLRTRTRLMHDGLTVHLDDAIQRHGGQATGVRSSYNALTSTQKAKLITFLNAL